MRLLVSFPLDLELNSTQDGRVWLVAQSLVNDVVDLLKAISLVRVVVMLGVLEVHVLPHYIRNTVLQRGLVPVFEIKRDVSVRERCLNEPSWQSYWDYANPTCSFGSGTLQFPT